MCLKTDTILLKCTLHQFQYFITTCLCRVSQMGSTGGGDKLGKMAKNCMKMTKSAFLDQNSGGGDMRGGGGRGQANFSGSGGGTHPGPPPPPLGETLLCMVEIYQQMFHSNSFNGNDLMVLFN